ncbi:hypothetical protein WJX73_000785 [Symbiochloris irregularis]|uniref:Exostosin GT47 domain-containing protein n=1 Tax=Symbiochloris irregularis TaxID=706552 RepID=A0AAW1PZN5_9CHLO
MFTAACSVAGLAWVACCFAAVAEAHDVPPGPGQAGQRRVDLLVYSYELPDQFHTLAALPEHTARQYNSFMYGAEKRVPEMLQEAGYLTTDAALADFFLVPAYLYAIRNSRDMRIPDADGMYTDRQVTNIVLDFIRQKHPFWNASAGKDHLWILTQDHGFCGFAEGEQTHDEIASSVILTHWGLTTPETPCSLRDRLQMFNSCPRRATVAAAAALGRMTPLNLPCFQPAKDAVIPSTAWDDLIFVDKHHPNNLSAGSNQKVIEAMQVEKENLLFFVGGTTQHKPAYSHGVRQTIINMFSNTEGFFLREKLEGHDPLSREQMFQEMGRSHFCLAASGSGWGVRLKLAAMLGCIPLVIQDDVRMPFEDVLPYAQFAVRLPQHMIHALPQTLEGLLQDDKRVSQMRSRLQCHLAQSATSRVG